MGKENQKPDDNDYLKEEDVGTNVGVKVVLDVINVETANENTEVNEVHGKVAKPSYDGNVDPLEPLLKGNDSKEDGIVSNDKPIDHPTKMVNIEEA